MAPVIFKEDVVVVTDGSSMDDDYQEWLTEQISQANSDYEEPSVEEMIQMTILQQCDILQEAEAEGMCAAIKDLDDAIIIANR